MERTICIFFLLICLIAGWESCTKSYTPKIVAGNLNYLVVEGFINIGNDSTIFNLSRTVKVNAGVDTAVETGAILNIEGNDNKSYPVPELGKGKYGVAGLSLDNTKQYRLRIKTTDGNSYLSDFTKAKLTPPIDSVGYTQLSNGIQVYVNTHDPNNNTLYYRWAYNETWEFHAFYPSFYYSDGSAIQQRTPDRLNFYCFTNTASTSITLGSSAKLKQDVIYHLPIIFIPATSEKIESRYSILLKQYALTSDEFNYWQSLQKNTEKIGSIFDSQPSEIQGNIHCISNPSLPVVGYVGSTNMQSKRVFIAKTELPTKWIATYPYTCPLDSFFYCRPPYCINDVAAHLIPQPSEEVPTTAIFGSDGLPVGFLGSFNTCIDCTIRGTKQKPSFW